jgi:predicted ATPase
MQLLERDDSLQLLRDLLDQARRGSGSFVFLSGEAGIGKTSLIRALFAEAEDQARVLVGACDPLSTPRAHGPLLDVATELSDDLRQLLDSETASDQIIRAALDALQNRRPTVLVI